jgi:hypothetical protein
MGFDTKLSKLCLKAFNNNLEKSLEFFNRNKDSLFNYEYIKEKLKLIRNSMPSDNDTLDTIESNLEKTKNAQELLSNIAKEMPDDDEAYLDFNLDEDAFFINKYYSLL